VQHSEDTTSKPNFRRKDVTSDSTESSVDLHEGAVSLETMEGEGSAFTFPHPVSSSERPKWVVSQLSITNRTAARCESSRPDERLDGSIVRYKD
jgi:hypothetical protein